MIARICVFGGGALFLLAIILLIYNFVIAPNKESKPVSGDESNILKEEEVKYFVIQERPVIDVQLLTPNEYSRPGIATETIENIVVHYTANPGTTAQQNRDFFEGLKDSHETSVSSHFVIGLEGEIIQCIPTIERAYASNQRNYNTVSIECCHMDETGKFNDGTYDSLVELCAWLCCKFNLQAEDVIRHYDVTGKACPKYFVDNQDEWENFIYAIDQYMDKNSVEVTKEEWEGVYGEGETVVTPTEEASIEFSE
ncbi:MAG: N-acetylmuramoyl-L-alanine amidase [Lachnospiraceae bacterium]|nr:N-acetylmuramoyl-L-alanine amidase [Lachnospiraceae bacterium]